MNQEKKCIKKTKKVYKKKKKVYQLDSVQVYTGMLQYTQTKCRTSVDKEMV